MVTEENTEEQLPQDGANSGQPSRQDKKDDIFMDYSQFEGAENSGHELDPNKVTVGLIGGQDKDNEGGLDVSQYTGPRSRPSNQFDDPQAPNGTGPGNGLSESDEGIRDDRWENPEPENDSF